jgi:hypothetical protein
MRVRVLSMRGIALTSNTFTTLVFCTFWISELTVVRFTSLLDSV